MARNHPGEGTRNRRASRQGDLVGPVCETGDYIARDRDMAEMQAGDLFAIGQPVLMVRYRQARTIPDRWYPKCWSAATSSTLSGRASASRN
ncbi:MAG: hypothetical protein R3D29_14520 [Nitratireductor sp.]